MTGYGRATAAVAGRSLTVQVSSVNRKSLDFTVKLPAEWASLESVIGERVRKFAVRGKVHVDIEFIGATAETGISWDDAAVDATLDKLSALAASHGVEFTPTPELLWEIAKSQRTPDEVVPVEAVEKVLLETLETALRSFAAMRAKEGETLLIDFLARVETLRRNVEAIAVRAPQVAPAYRELLLKRLRDAGLELNIDDERVLKEIALFADRVDITEEITRFRSHMEQFVALLKSDGEAGRKAEFILQEMGREVHTMGSKANDLTIAKQVIELKNELERVKEQIANVE